MGHNGDIMDTRRTVFKIFFKIGVGSMDFDWRLLVVLGPIAIALGWALFNIGQAALGQVQNYLNRQS